nr:MAG TPA: minor tail protein [Caudoviricetes sp.]
MSESAVISVEVKLDPQLDNIKKQIIDKLQKPMVQTALVIEKAMTDAFSAVTRSAEDAGKAVAKAVARISSADSAVSSMMKNIVSDTSKLKSEFSKTFDDIKNSTLSQMQKLTDQIQKSLENVQLESDPVSGIDKRIEAVRQKVGLLQKKWQELSSAMEAMSPKASEKLAAALSSIKDKAKKAGAAVKEKVGAAFGAVKNVGAKAAEKIVSGLGAMTKKAASAAVSVKSGLTSAVTKAASAVGNVLGGAFTTVKNIGSRAVGALKSGFSALGGLVGGVFKTAGDFVKNQFSSALTSACMGNEEFARSFGDIQSNLQTAFTPIISAVMPALNTLMSALASVSQGVAGFISGLFGTTYEKAQKSVKMVGEAGKEAKKASVYLSSFDEMNVAGNDSADNTQTAQPDMDTSSLDSKGSKWAEGLGESIRSFLSSAFESVGEKAENIFSNLSSWAQTSFAPTFEGIWSGLEEQGAQLGEILGGMFADISTLGEPLKEYFAGDFTVFLQTVFAAIGQSAVGLLDSFNLVFSDIWNVVVFPILNNFIEVALPMITQFATEIVSTLGVLFEQIKIVFDTLWTEAVQPVLSLFSEMWIGLMTSLSEFWAEWGEPIFDGLKQAITGTGETLLNIWESVLKPVWDKVVETVDMLWTDHIKPLIDNFLDFIGELVTGAEAIYNKFILPIVNWFVEKLGPPVSAVINKIIEIVGGVIGKITDAVSGIITALKGIVQFITGVFTADWEKAFTGIKNIFKGIWDSLSNIVKIPINLIIDLINGLTGAIEKGLNWIINGINDALSFDIPDWLGGGTFGIDIPNVDIPEIPHLASGGLAYAPQLAMVGDNRNARTDPEVIAPLSKLEGAMGGGQLYEIAALLREIIAVLKGLDLTVTGNIDGRVLWRSVIKMYRQYKTRTGGITV